MQAARGELDAAEALAREAVEIAATTDYFELAATAWLDLAEILRAAGKGEAGAGAARAALGLYERKGNLVGVRRAQVLAGAAPGLGRDLLGREEAAEPRMERDSAGSGGGGGI